MGKKLAATVHVDGVVYPAGSEVDGDVAKRISNPKAWGEEPKGASADDEGQDGEGEGDKPARGRRSSNK